MHRRQQLLLGLLAAVGCAHGASLNADSVAYSVVREQAVIDSASRLSLPAIIASTDELAAEGLFDVAVDLLSDALSSDTTGDQPEPADSSASQPRIPATVAPGKTVSWAIDLSGDLSSWADSTLQDSLLRDSSGSAESRDNNGQVRVRLNWRPSRFGVERVSPALLLSDSRAQFSLGCNLAGPDKYLLFDVSGQIEKRIFQDYGDSSDAVRSHARLTLTTRPDNRPIILDAPIEAEIGLFRHDRPGYSSYRTVSARPSIELNPTTQQVHLSLAWPAKYNDYADPDDSLSGWSHGPQVSLDVWDEVASLMAQASYEVSHQPRNGTPRRERTASLDLTPSITPARGLSVELAGGLSYEAAQHVDLVYLSVDTTLSIPLDTIRDTSVIVQAGVPALATYTMRGWEVSLRPAVEVSPVSALMLGLGCGVEIKRYPVVRHLPDGRELSEPVYLWESLNAYEPELSVGLRSSPVDARVGARYRIENIAEKKFYFLRDSRSLTLTLDAQCRIVTWLSAEASGEYVHKTYPDDGSASHNYSVSAGVSARF